MIEKYIRKGIQHESLSKIRLSILLHLFTCSTFNITFGQFERVTMEDGLSSPTITSIKQDDQGFLWISTFNGLNRYDGYNFKVFRHDPYDSNSLSINEISEIYLDNQGYIWIIPVAGETINIYDSKTDKFLRFQLPPVDSNSTTRRNVNNVIQDSLGYFWVSSESDLNKVVMKNMYDEHNYIITSYPVPSDNLVISEIYQNQSGKILVFSDTLLYFDEEREKLVSTHTFIQDDILVNSVGEDKNGNLWIGTNFGLYKLKYSKESDTYEKVDIGRINVEPEGKNNILLDSKNRLWIGTESKGLYLFDTNKDTLVQFVYNETNNTSISSNTIFSLFIDGSGVLWVGTFDQGLCKYNLYKKPFYHLYSSPQNPNSLSGNVISSIHSTRDNEIWVGIDLNGGINKLVYENNNLNPNIFRYIPDTESNQNSVLSLVQRKNGDVWACRVGGAISVLKKNKMGHYNFEQEFFQWGYWKFNIIEDRDQRMWVGSWGNGLYKFDESGNYIAFLNDPEDPRSISNNIIWSIFEDNSGNLWIGGRENGFSILPYSEKNKDTLKFINYKHEKGNPNSISNNMINVFCQAKDGTMWIGTSSGLNKVIRQGNDFSNITEDNTLGFSVYHEKDGLVNEQVNGIVESDNGDLWLSTFGGLSHFVVSKDTFINYTVEDGLQGNEFWHNAYFKDQNGRIYFGGSNGLNIFYPDSIKPNPFVPKVAITDFKLFYKSVKVGEEVNGDVILNKPINETSEIILSYRNNVLLFEFAALHFTNPKKNKYAYKMEGFDKNWNYVGNRRDATYTNMNPGEYIFRVKASNNDGLWNNDGMAISLKILPPWYNTLLFYIFAGLIIVGTIVTIYYLRITQIKRQKVFLEKQVKKRTKDLNKANEDLKYINVQLEARQQQIEEQSEELKCQAEELTSTNKSLKETNATKDKLFSIIAHDLKNPLSSIIGFNEILIKKYDKLDDEKKLKFLIAMFNSTKNISGLLENLLSWARSQSGQLNLNIEEIQLEHLINSCVNLLKSLAQSKNNKISSKVDGTIIIHSDQNILNAVLRNLLTNANKFTEDGTIDIEAFKSDNNSITIEIKDSGTGISPKKLQTIFNIENSKSTEGTKGETGTGLGLILCKEFIGKLNGEIKAESELGKGSIFTIILPDKIEY